ncbi:hypothetical protein BGS_0376 [Beggiatoa sp. SS]|nr:hypothetical protein BGS_0376 [Beggiatoa sp. SS]
MFFPLVVQINQQWVYPLENLGPGHSKRVIGCGSASVNQKEVEKVPWLE